MAPNQKEKEKRVVQQAAGALKKARRKMLEAKLLTKLAKRLLKIGKKDGLHN